MIDAAAAAAKVTLPDRGWLLSIRKTIEIDIHIDRNNMVRIRVRAHVIHFGTDAKQHFWLRRGCSEYSIHI